MVQMSKILYGLLFPPGRPFSSRERLYNIPENPYAILEYTEPGETGQRIIMMQLRNDLYYLLKAQRQACIPAPI